MNPVFKIVDKEGNEVSFKTLDEQACFLWDKKASKEHYAYPTKDEKYPENASIKETRDIDFYNLFNSRFTWFYMIGGSIEKAHNKYPEKTLDWNLVINTLIVKDLYDALVFHINCVYRLARIKEDYEGNIIIPEPYIDLINNWIIRGYKHSY